MVRIHRNMNRPLKTFLAKGSELLKQTVMQDFAELWPESFATSSTA
jgi:hypothetical protein